jgi:TRAP-type uncharacterized transport system fused permease subunit
MAAAANGDPYKTTMQCWKYTVPAFLLPFMFVLDPAGQGLLLNGSMKNLAHANWGSIIGITLIAAVGIAAIAAGFQGWALKRATLIERVLFIVAGFLLVLPGAFTDAAGFACIGVALLMQWLRREPAAKAASP